MPPHEGGITCWDMIDPRERDSRRPDLTRIARRTHHDVLPGGLVSGGGALVGVADVHDDEPAVEVVLDVVHSHLLHLRVAGHHVGAVSGPDGRGLAGRGDAAGRDGGAEADRMGGEGGHFDASTEDRGRGGRSGSCAEK